jgi:hypothetical protein
MLSKCSEENEKPNLLVWVKGPSSCVPYALKFRILFQHGFYILIGIYFFFDAIVFNRADAFKTKF